MTETVPEGGFVTLHNPHTGDPWECPAPAVEAWEAKGWTRAPASEKSLSSMNKDELLAAAAARGVTVEEGATKADILAAIQAQEG